MSERPKINIFKIIIYTWIILFLLIISKFILFFVDIIINISPFKKFVLYTFTYKSTPLGYFAHFYTAATVFPLMKLYFILFFVVTIALIIMFLIWLISFKIVNFDNSNKPIFKYFEGKEKFLKTFNIYFNEVIDILYYYLEEYQSDINENFTNFLTDDNPKNANNSIKENFKNDDDEDIEYEKVYFYTNEKAENIDNDYYSDERISDFFKEKKYYNVNVYKYIDQSNAVKLYKDIGIITPDMNDVEISMLYATNKLLEGKVYVLEGESNIARNK